MLRLRLAARRLPAQLPAPGRTERNVVGLPLAAVAVRALGLFLVTTGWELTGFGGTDPLAVLVPQVIVGGFLATIVLWPFLEARATGDRREHHLLDRPRDRPIRTALGVAGIVFFLTLWVAGATDLVTTQLSIAFKHQVVALRTLLLLGPLVAFQVTRQVCLSLVVRDREVAAQGFETGRIVCAPDGGYFEIHAPSMPAPAPSSSTGRSYPIGWPDSREPHDLPRVRTPRRDRVARRP